MTVTRLRAVALAAAVLGGCGVPLEERGEQLHNSCTVDEECGAEDVCIGGRCVSTRASLSGLLLQVDLPMSSPFGAGTSTLIDPADDGMALQGRSETGYYVGYDIGVPALVNVADVTLQVESLPEGCAAAEDGSVPLAVQFHPAENLVGLPSTVYSAASGWDAGEDPPAELDLSLQVPAGTYDIYVALNRDPDDQDDPNRTCPLPPVLLSGHELSGANVTVNISVAPPTELTGVITGLNENLPLNNWTIELVENGHGRPISTAEEFSDNVSLDDIIRDGRSFAIQFWPELADQAVIRLSPPEEAAAMPTILWRLDAVDLDGDHHVGLSLADLATATPVEIEGSIFDGTADDGVGATVTIQSQELLDGEFGTNAAYRTTSDAGSEGRFDVSLLPGTYKVIAVPGGDFYQAITEESWKINQNDLGGGKTLEVNPKADMLGSVHTAGGQPAYDTSLNLQPSATSALSYQEQVLSTYDLLPTNATGLTNGAGVFGIKVDPGVFDLSIRPEDASGYPWLVRARVTIQASEEPTVADMGALTLSNPVLLTGWVLSPGGTGLAGATIRAWLPVPDEDAEPGTPPTVIQIAQTISDGQGGYALLLPASISQ